MVARRFPVKLPPFASGLPPASRLARAPVWFIIRRAGSTNARRWTASPYIAIMQYMKATALARSKEVRDDGTIVEVVIWELPDPLPPCEHRFKYRLFYGRPGEERVRYDNERGKGDHRHAAGVETQYEFVSLDRLLDDFERDIQAWSAT